MIKPICDVQAKTEAVCFGNDDVVDIVGLDRDDKNLGIKADLEVVP